MRSLQLILVFCFVFYVRANDSSPAETIELQTTQQHEKKLSEYIDTILEHYKQENPVGIPGTPIPDPLPIPPLTQSFSVGKMNFRDMQLYGLKKFKVDHVAANLGEMRVKAGILFDKLDVMGNYTLRTWLSSAQGNFTVKLTNVFVTAIAELEVQRNGSLEAQDIKMDITFKNMDMDFQGLGFFATMFQGVINSVGTFVFDSIKPFMLKEANTNIRNDINKQVSKISQKFPNSISPLDQLISEVRKKVRNMNYDPYKLPDYNNSVGIFDIYLTHTWLNGLSSFHRTKDIIFELKNKTVHTLLEVGTQKLIGSTHWEVSLIAGVMSRLGVATFSVEYVKVQINASQSMDTRKRPCLDDIQIEIGNIQIRFDGLGTMDYVIEFGINVLPNLLRYQIMDAIEKPIKVKIQEELNKINVEKLIKENAERLENGSDFSDFGNLL